MSDTHTRMLEAKLVANPADQETRDRLERERERSAKIRQPLPKTTPDLWEGEGHTAKPKVGMAATYGAGSDSYPGTVIKVSPSGHQITVRADAVEGLSGSFRSDDWRGQFFANPDGTERVYTRRRRKRCAYCGAPSPLDAERCDKQYMCRWDTTIGDEGGVSVTRHPREPKWRPIYRQKGSSGRGNYGNVHLGSRRYYQDPHF